MRADTLTGSEPSRSDATTSEQAGPARPRSLLGTIGNPYFQIGVGALLVTASEMLMKKGAIDPASGNVGWLGISALGSLWTWLGILTYIMSFLSWIYVLRLLPLGVAYALINVAHVLVPLGSWLFLHEAVSPQRWAGIGLVVCGILLILKPVVNAEKKL